MLFRRKIPRSCAYCVHGTKFDDSTILCIKRGIVPSDKSCRKFSYDPCKRVPPRPKAVNFNKYNSEDFSL